MVKCLGGVFISVVTRNYRTDQEGYFYLGAGYEELNSLCIVLALIPTIIERLPHYQRFGLFAVYATVDLILSVRQGAGTVLLENYNVPIIGEDIIFFYFAVCVSICFKTAHLFLVIAIILLSHNNERGITSLEMSLPPPYGNPPSMKETLFEMPLPPPYETPPSYIVTLMKETK